jgi:hypothetical protein
VMNKPVAQGLCHCATVALIRAIRLYIAHILSGSRSLEIGILQSPAQHDVIGHWV